MEPKKKAKKAVKKTEKKEQQIIASVREDSPGEEVNHDAERSPDANDLEVKPDFMVDEQKEISTEEIDQISAQSNESPDESPEFIAQENNGNDSEMKSEITTEEEKETSTGEIDQLSEQQNESHGESSEFVAQKNNGVEENQDEIITEPQEIISVSEDSFGEERTGIPEETDNTLNDSPEIISVREDSFGAENDDLKSQHDEAPVELEAVSSPKESSRTEAESSVNTPEEKAAPEEKNNAAYLSSQVDKLIRLKDEHNFVDFWFYVKELNKMIFTLRGLQKDERMKFKERIGELCEDAKKMQDELKAKIAKTSHLKLDRIQQMVDEAISFGTSHEEMEKSFHKIEEANKFLREGKVQAEDGEESADMSRDHREKAKEIIKGAKDKIFDRKREIREGNFKKVTQRLNAISDSLMSQGRPQKVFDGIKSLRNEMRLMNLDRSQLREIDNVIETIWKKAREKASTGRVYESKKRITDMQDLARRKEKFIQTLESEIKELNVKWSSNVKNDFFKNRVNEWIEEKKQKIEETKKEMQSIDEKIKFLTEQLNRT
ncbi:MAG TPA: hypothetical protein VE978_26315 [Chitinophagales bacterium]|nr:hypothetical protein [Chitinophagales bacterium]